MGGGDVCVGAFSISSVSAQSFTFSSHFLFPFIYNNLLCFTQNDPQGGYVINLIDDCSCLFAKTHKRYKLLNFYNYHNNRMLVFDSRMPYQ